MNDGLGLHLSLELGVERRLLVEVALLDRAGPRESGLAHEVVVDLDGGGTTFLDAPDDQALAASAIASGEDARDVGRVLARRGLDVRARILLDAELLKHGVLGAEEAESEEAELAREELCGIERPLAREDEAASTKRAHPLSPALPSSANRLASRESTRRGRC